MSQNVWVVFSASTVAQQLRELIDKGMLAEANSYSYYLQSFLDTVKTLVRNRGGHMAINLYDRQIAEIPLSVVDELPKIVDDYREKFKNKLAVGIGLTLQEASRATERSFYTGNIELFEPGDFDDVPSAYQKAEDSTEPWEIPPNLFCPKSPSPEDDSRQLLSRPTDPPKAVTRPDLAQEMEAEAQLIAAINQQLLPAAAGSSGNQQQQHQPQNILEALHGGPVPGAVQQPQQGTAPESGGSGQQQSTAPVPEQLETAVEDAEAEAEKSNQKLARLLSTVRVNLPQIMAMHDTNPEAFKNAMQMISKLVQLAHGRQRQQKSEADCDAESLEKAFRRGIYRAKGRTRRRWPVGTRKGRRIKVLIDGKEVWRSVGAGQVKDHRGESISVRSSNYYAENPHRSPQMKDK